LHRYARFSVVLTLFFFVHGTWVGGLAAQAGEAAPRVPSTGIVASALKAAIAAGIDAKGATATGRQALDQANRVSRTASTRPGRWEVELHGSGSISTDLHEGLILGSLPPPGPDFVLTAGRAEGTFIISTTAVSSWFFGQGATILNRVNAADGVSGRITPLDGVLMRSGGTWSNSGGVGARVSYAITPRLSAEFSLDAPFGELVLSDTLLSAVESSRASFETAWNAQTGLTSRATRPFLAFNNTLTIVPAVVFGNSAVSSIATIDNQSRQFLTTGALGINLATRGRVVPFVLGGAGIASSIGDSPSVKLTGNYRFPASFVGSTTTLQVNETDAIAIRVGAASAHPFLAVFGGGVKIMSSVRWGLRAEARGYVSWDAANVVLDATPQVVTGTPAGVVYSTAGVQFSTLPVDPSIDPKSLIPTRQSTLSGPPIAGFSTYSSGVNVRFVFSLGYFIRF
jgi:hypothetical protein